MLLGITMSVTCMTNQDHIRTRLHSSRAGIGRARPGHRAVCCLETRFLPYIHLAHHLPQQYSHLFHPHIDQSMADIELDGDTNFKPKFIPSEWIRTGKK